MLGTTLTRESPAAIRPIPSRTVAPPPVLIEVPTLPGARPRRSRSAWHRRPAGARPRRRLRREVRWVGSAAAIGALAVAATFTLTAPRSVPAGEPTGTGHVAADPFSIELNHPIPVPAEAIADRSASRLEALPVAFPGYLLPGDGDGDGDVQSDGGEELGHARP